LHKARKRQFPGLFRDLRPSNPSPGFAVAEQEESIVAIAATSGEDREIVNSRWWILTIEVSHGQA
jgi:hypothetical protein